MSKTPDRHPGPLYEDEEVVLQEQATDPDIVGAIRRVGGSIKARDATGVFDLRSGGGGITEAQHKALRQLIHFIDDGPADSFAGAYKEILPAGDPFPTSEIWWDSASKLHKIVELSITRSANKMPTSEVWKIYDASDVLLLTVTDTVDYSSVFETSRTRVVTT